MTANNDVSSGEGRDIGRLEAKRFGFAVIIVGLCVLAWFAVNTLRKSMRLGYIDSAIVRVRAVGAAEVQFAKAHPNVGYTCSISQLPQDEDGIVARLAHGAVENGYAFGIVGCQASRPQKPNSAFQVTAHPLHSGLPAFCSDASGVVSYDESGSVEKCLATGISW